MFVNGGDGMLTFIEVTLFLLPVIFLYLNVIKGDDHLVFRVILFIITVIIVVFHIIFGTVRWQLFPLYIVLLMMIIISIFKMNRPFINRRLKVSLSITVVGLVIISVAMVFSFPRYQMPKPLGEYLIGTENFIIENRDRLEKYSEQQGDYRTFKIQLWYPAETVDGYEQAPWIDDGLEVSRALAKNNFLPFFALDHTTSILSNAYYEAPINDDLDQYPVIVISHGWSGFRNLHADFAEELASYGYIVVSIDHTYGSVATELDDGFAYLNEEALPSRDTTQDFLTYANELVDTYASDVIRTLDYQEELNNPTSRSRFRDRLDLSKIGLLGHSTGGGANALVALQDERVEALIGLDAWVEPIEDSALSQGLTIPSLFLRSESWETGENNAYLYDLIEQSSDALLYQIDGTTHFDFAMIYMYSPLTKYIGFTGSVESERLTLMLKSMIVSFFNEELDYTNNVYTFPTAWDEVRHIEIP